MRKRREEKYIRGSHIQTHKHTKTRTRSLSNAVLIVLKDIQVFEVFCVFPQIAEIEGAESCKMSCGGNGG